MTRSSMRPEWEFRPVSNAEQSIVIGGVHLLTVRSTDNLVAATDRRLFKSSTGTQFLQDTRLLELLLEALEGFVDGLVLFQLDDERHF